MLEQKLAWTLWLGVALSASAQPPPQAAAAAVKTPPPLSEHVRTDVARHLAMAQAHEAAARCLESGRSEEDCVKALQSSCKGLGIGKYCGLRHEH